MKFGIFFLSKLSNIDCFTFTRVCIYTCSTDATVLEVRNATLCVFSIVVFNFQFTFIITIAYFLSSTLFFVVVFFHTRNCCQNEDVLDIHTICDEPLGSTNKFVAVILVAFLYLPIQPTFLPICKSNCSSLTNLPIVT